MALKKSSTSIIVIFIFLCLVKHLSAQNTQLSDQALNFYESENYNQAVSFSERSIEELLDKEKIDSSEISKIHIHLTTSHYRLGNYKKCIEVANRGLTFSPKTEEGYNTKAKILYWRSFPEYFLNKPYQSFESKKEALIILKKLNEPDLEFLTGVYAELSLDMAFMGYLDRASSYLEKAIEVNTIKNTEALKYNRYNLSEDLSLWLKYRLAQIANKKIDLEYNKVSQGVLKEIILDYKSIETQKPSHLPKNYKVMFGAIYGYYGNSFLKNSSNKKNIDSALYYYNMASKKFSSKDNFRHYNVIQYNIAKALFLKKKYKESLEIIDKLIADKNNPSTSTYSSLRAEIMLKLKKYDEWKMITHQTLSDIHDSPETLKTDFSNFVPSSSIAQTSNILSLAESIDENDSELSSFLKTKRQLYDLSIDQFKNSYRLSTFNLRLKNYYSEAFEGVLSTMEHSKVKNLNQIKNLINDSENIENRLAWKRFSTSRRLVELNSIDSLERVEYQLRNQLVKAKQQGQSRKIDSITDQLEQHRLNVSRDYPKYATFTENDFEVSNFQQLITKDEVVLKYLFFKNKFAIFEITRDSVRYHLKNWRSEEKEILEHHINQIKNLKVHLELDERLTNILVPTEALKFKKITVIADTPIYQLPFETLILNAQFLVEQKSIRYSSHLRFAYVDDENNSLKEEAVVGIFAPDYPKTQDTSKTRSVPYYLEGAQEEAKAINNIFESKIYIGKQATKEKFIEHKSDGTILHLAMHATMDEVTPEFSHFNFPDNKKLYLEELYALNISVDLAVLGACNTANGKADNSLNINSLHRAFNFAGAEATVASLWEVPDESTKVIMIDFYKNLKKGLDKSSALRQAKSNYLSQTDNAMLKHPYYWAGFVLYGDDVALVQAESDSLYYLLFGGVFIIFVFGLLFHKNNLSIS